MPIPYLIDADNAVIVDVDATTAIRQAEIVARPATPGWSSLSTTLVDGVPLALVPAQGVSPFYLTRLVHSQYPHGGHDYLADACVTLRDNSCAIFWCAWSIGSVF